MIFNRPIPQRIAGHKLWIDTSTTRSLFTDSARTTAVTNNDDPIGGIADLSGSGNHASQASSTLRPLYKTTGPGLVGDGTDDYLTIGSVVSSGAWTMTMVLERESTTGALVYYAAGTDYGGLFTHGSGVSQWGLRTSTTTMQAGAGINISAGVRAAISVVHDGSGNYTFYKNNVAGSTVAGGAQGLTGLALGYRPSFGFYSQSKIHELQVYNSALDSTNRALLQSYLAKKWSL